MLLNNRHGAVDSDSYRYGFQGQEGDDEVKGGGAQYDYGFRIYDPRLARFLNLDPFYTPYQFAGNKPIYAIDLDGLEEQIVVKHVVTKSDRTQIQEGVDGQTFNLYLLNESNPNKRFQKNITTGWETVRDSYKGSGTVYSSNEYTIPPMPSINKNGTIFMQAYITRSLDSIHQPTPPPPPSPIQNPEPPENIQKKKPAVRVEEGEKANTVIPNENPIPQERRSPTVNNTLVDIPFLPTEAKYENYNSARSTLNPILDKIKSDPMSKIVITVKVEIPRVIM
ncbi:hypothetical protein F0365_07485 [Nonlabens sp. Ci31]|nr:hypothetical protein F0365_07485 [Nonlabens sp. Ci31]